MKTTPHRPESPGRRRALVLAIGLALAACGGGDPQAVEPRRRATGGVDSGGTGGKRSFFSAALQRSAPLSAAGVDFDTQACTFVDADGAPIDGAGMAAGMTVWIDASAVVDVGGQPTASALQLRLADQLVGAVEAVDAVNGTLTVLGQTVAVDVSTAFDTDLAANWSLLVPGMRVRVWGQLDIARRRTVATRIDRPEPAGPDLVRGVLAALDPVDGALAIGGLVATPMPGASLPADLAAGQVVRLSLAPGAGPSRWQAVRADPLLVPDRETVELEGRVTAIVSAAAFELDGVPVDATGAGGLPPGFSVGMRVAAAGVSSGGVLQARTLTLQVDEPDLITELHGVVQQVDAAQSSFVVRGRTVRWSAQTRFEGGTPAMLRRRARLELKGRRAADGSIDAFFVHIER